MNFGFIKQYFGLPGRIYVLFLARIIAAMGSFVYSFLTLFMSSKLGYSEITISGYLMLLAVIMLPATLLGGKLADLFSRKMTYVVLMTFGEISFLITGFLIDKPYVLKFIFAGFFFVNAAAPAISAMMMDFTRPENRRESMSLVYLGFNLGYAFGPMIAGFLFVHYLRWIFWGNALINLISVILILLMIRDEAPDAESLKSAESDVTDVLSDKALAPPKRNLLLQLLSDPILVVVAALAMTSAFGYSQIGYMLPLDMEDYFGIEVGSRAYGVIWSLNGFTVFLLTPLFVYVLKKRNVIFNLAIGSVMFAVGFAGYAFTHNLPIMYMLVAVWTSGEVIGASNVGVFIASHAPVRYRARYQSIYDIIQGTGRAVGPMLMGYFLAGHTISQGWLLCGGLCAVSAIAYFVMSASGKR